MDVNLVDFVYSIPSHHLIKRGYSKQILRESVKNILNDKVRLDRRKKGFNASINSIINLDEKSTHDYFLSDSPIFDIIKKDKIEKLLNENPIKTVIANFFLIF